MKQEHITSPLYIQINLTKSRAAIVEQTGLVDLDRDQPYMLTYDIDPTGSDSILTMILPPHAAQQLLETRRTLARMCESCKTIENTSAYEVYSVKLKRHMGIARTNGQTMTSLLVRLMPEAQPGYLDVSVMVKDEDTLKKLIRTGRFKFIDLTIRDGKVVKRA